MQRFLFLSLLVLATACGGSTEPKPPAVASVSVSLASTQVAPGASTSAVAAIKGATGETLTGRAVSWSSSNTSMATVNAGGVISAITPGTVTVSATSEGQTGSATLLVKYNITSVTISGSARVKVGDSYSYSVTPKLADGSVVVRPVAWNVKEVGAGSISAGGVLTPLQAGTLTLQAIIDGDIWESTYTAYDWQSFASSGNLFTSVEADVQITNKFGSSEYPQLVMSCGTSGNFFVWISTTGVVTQNGIVAMSFDGGTAFVQTWDELSPSYRTLWKPGSNGTVKAFAQQIAAARTFGFAFTEFQGTAKATIFRVGGLAQRLAPLTSQCSSNSIAASLAEFARTDSVAFSNSPSAPRSEQLTALRQSRARSLPSFGITPSLMLPTVAQSVEQQAIRRKQ